MYDTTAFKCSNLEHGEQIVDKSTPQGKDSPSTCNYGWYVTSVDGFVDNSRFYVEKNDKTIIYFKGWSIREIIDGNFKNRLYR